MSVFAQRKLEELARESEEQGEPVSSAGNKSSLTSKGTNTTNESSDANSSRIALTDEFDSSVATHNIVCSYILSPYLSHFVLMVIHAAA